MRPSLWMTALLFVSNSLSLALPQPITDIQLLAPEVAADLDRRNYEVFGDVVKDLGKRKGGGGGGGKGGGGGSSGGSSEGGSSGSGSSGSGSSSSSSSGTKGGSGSSGSSSSGSSGTGKGSSGSSVGGSTKTGSGVRPAYGGGRYYGGGATTPYAAGRASPLGIAPILLIAGVGALALYPGVWPYGAYSYPYHNPYTFDNRTANSNSTNTVHKRQATLDTNTGVNETKPVTCLCAAYQECGCDDTGDTTFLDQLIGNGSYAALNKTLVTVADIKGTSTIILNGTLPNGTTASGGTENADGSSSGASTSIVQVSGYWVMLALVGCTVLLV